MKHLYTRKEESTFPEIKMSKTVSEVKTLGNPCSEIHSFLLIYIWKSGEKGPRYLGPCPDLGSLGTSIHNCQPKFGVSMGCFKGKSRITAKPVETPWKPPCLSIFDGTNMDKTIQNPTGFSARHCCRSHPADRREHFLRGCAGDRGFPGWRCVLAGSPWHHPSTIHSPKVFQYIPISVPWISHHPYIFILFSVFPVFLYS